MEKPLFPKRKVVQTVVMDPFSEYSLSDHEYFNQRYFHEVSQVPIVTLTQEHKQYIFAEVHKAIVTRCGFLTDEQVMIMQELHYRFILCNEDFTKFAEAVKAAFPDDDNALLTSQQQEEGKYNMKTKQQLANVAAMVADNVVGVQVVLGFDTEVIQSEDLAVISIHHKPAAGEKVYTFKALRDFAKTLQPNDIVIAGGTIEKRPRTGCVVKVLDEFLPERDDIVYSWIFQKVNIGLYCDILKAEQAMVDDLYLVQKRNVRENMLRSIGVDLDTVKRNIAVEFKEE